MRKTEIDLAIFDDVITIPTGVVCADGFRISIQAGSFHYCLPRDAEGPYTHVELGFPSERPEPWTLLWETLAKDIDDPTGTVYGYVPVEIAWELLKSHGGILIEMSYRAMEQIK